MVGEATCDFKLACPRKGHAVCRSNATGPRLARCWFWEIDPMPFKENERRCCVRLVMFFPKTEPIRLVFETVSRVAGGL